MKKDFTRWFALKTKIENESVPPIFHVRDIWWCALGANIGVEQDGKNELHERPILVLRKYNNDSLFALPMTKKKKTGAFCCSFTQSGVESFVLMSQARSISSKRLLKRMNRLNWKLFEYVNDSYATYFENSNPAKKRGSRVPFGDSVIGSTVDPQVPFGVSMSNVSDP